MRMSTDENRDEELALQTIAAAAEAGITVFDTARAYGLGESELGHNEQLLARALRHSGAETSARIVTKGGMTRAGGGWIPDGRAKAILADCEATSWSSWASPARERAVLRRNTSLVATAGSTATSVEDPCESSPAHSMTSCHRARGGSSSTIRISPAQREVMCSRRRAGIEPVRDASGSTRRSPSHKSMSSSGCSRVLALSRLRRS